MSQAEEIEIKLWGEWATSTLYVDILLEKIELHKERASEICRELWNI